MTNKMIKIEENLYNILTKRYKDLEIKLIQEKMEFIEDLRKIRKSCMPIHYLDLYKEKWGKRIET